MNEVRQQFFFDMLFQNFSTEITKTEPGPTLSLNSSKSGNKCNRQRKVTLDDLEPRTLTGELLDFILDLKDRFSN
jgi:hypothetical protein